MADERRERAHAIWCWSFDCVVLTAEAVMTVVPAVLGIAHRALEFEVAHGGLYGQ